MGRQFKVPLIFEDIYELKRVVEEIERKAETTEFETRLKEIFEKWDRKKQNYLTKD